MLYWHQAKSSEHIKDGGKMNLDTTRNNKNRLDQRVNTATKAFLTTLAAVLVFIMLISSMDDISHFMKDLDHYYSRHPDELVEIAERLGTDSEALRVYEYNICVDYDLAAGDIKRSRGVSDDEFNNVVAEYTSDDILEKMSSICTDIQNDTGNESAYIIAYFYYTDPGCSVFCINYFADGSYRFSDLR